PIIVLSGTGDEDVILRCFGAGATDYLIKPFGEGELRAKVKILLHRAREQRDAESRRARAVFDAEGNWKPDDLVGRFFAGYEIVEKIGEGGMGVVYKSTCTATHRTLALKVLHPEFARDKQFLKRFFREATNLKEVEHENIARFHELGHDHETYYIAMEYVDGVSLEQYLAKRELLKEIEIVDVVIQVAQALNALHKHGIVHRDIKPGNVLMTADGVCKLVDFGLTRRPTDERITENNVFFGTATYMSPEQARGSAAIDVRSDIYALGVLFYYLATGDVPFDGDDSYGILFRQVHDPPDEPQSKNALLSDTVNFMILKMLAKDPGRRYQTPAELLRALRKHRDVLAKRTVDDAQIKTD
ncbi:MAG: lipopolysaccharide core heptose(II) kinase RfaY, partial [Planctomycetota bacterium]